MSTTTYVSVEKYENWRGTSTTTYVSVEKYENYLPDTHPYLDLCNFSSFS